MITIEIINDVLNELEINGHEELEFLDSQEGKLDIKQSRYVYFTLRASEEEINVEGTTRQNAYHVFKAGCNGKLSRLHDMEEEVYEEEDYSGMGVR